MRGAQAAQQTLEVTPLATSRMHLARDDAEQPGLGQLAASVYAPLISNQLDLERARKASIEGRALSVVQITAGLVTVFVSVAGFDLRIDQKLGQPAMSYFAAASICFLIAAGLALWANCSGNLQSSFAELPKDDLEAWLDDWDSTDQAGASRRAAQDQLRTLSRARKLNTSKRHVLSGALACEATAVLVLLAGVGRLAGLL